jgi:2-amino-4-hydroxy-6-hydroxymethyldihydropteridine diphosphokinase
MSFEPITAHIALGANLGAAADTLLWAVQQVGALPHVQLIAKSSLYRSAPIDSSGPDYINAVIAISIENYHWPAYSLLRELQKIEQIAGRERPYRNAPRTLDLDILLYGDATIESDVLTIPHPRMWQRAFVLLPLHEIAPEIVSTVALQAVADQRIEKITSRKT